MTLPGKPDSSEASEMTDVSHSVSLTRPQREMLSRIADSTYGSHCIMPKGRRTADVLVRLGLLKNIGQGWAEITPAGRDMVGAWDATGSM